MRWRSLHDWRGGPRLCKSHRDWHWLISLTCTTSDYSLIIKGNQLPPSPLVHYWLMLGSRSSNRHMLFLYPRHPSCLFGTIQRTAISGIAGRGGVLWVLEHPLCPHYKACNVHSLTATHLVTWVISGLAIVMPLCKYGSGSVFDVRGVVNQLTASCCP